MTAPVSTTSYTTDEARLTALHAASLLDTAPEEAFDRLTRLVARFLGAPVALLSLVDDRRQFFKSEVGLQEPWATRRETPLSHAFCRIVVESRTPLIVENAHEHPALRDHPGIAELGIAAYAGVPLATRDGHVLGSLCAIDCVSHTWSPVDIEVLHDLAASVMAEIELRAEVAERRRAQALALGQQRVLERLALGHSLDVVLNQIIELAETASPNLVAAIVRNDVSRRRLRVDGSATVSIALRNALEDLDLAADGPAALALHTGVAVHVDHADADQRWTDATRARAVELGLRSCSAYPITSDNRTIGTLVLFSSAEVAPRSAGADVIDSALALTRTAIERHEALEARRITEERFRLLVENVEAGFFVIELPEWRLAYESPALVSLAGRALGEGSLDPVAWLARVHEDDRPRVAKSLADSFEHPIGIDYRIRTADGAVRYVHDRTFLVRDANGAPTHLVGILADVTGRSLALAQVQALIDTAPVAIIEMDRNFTVLRWNPAAERMFGYAAADVVGKPYPLVPAARQAEFDATLDRLFRGEQYDNVEIRRQRNDGTFVDVLISSVLVSDTNGRPTSVVGFLTDVSQRKTLEEELRQAQKMEAIGQLAGGIAHDFNNLLTAILGNIDIARSELVTGHPVHDPLVDARDAASRAATLTRQLLMFSRKQPSEPRQLDLNLVLRDASKLLHRALNERAVLDLVLANELPFVLADAGQIEQILMNLVVNARDAMPLGGIVTVESGIVDLETAADLPAGRYARLAVRDTGVGIPANVIGRVFEPFFTTKPVGLGTGLGLATVYGIARHLNGTVRVESEPGNGSTFTVLLPLVVASERKAAATAAVAAIPGGTERVLVVEDESTIRTLVKRLLERRGYSVFEARHGGDAHLVWKEQSQHIDLVLTDLRMPEMGGIELVDILRKDRPEIAVLFMTGYAGVEDSFAQELARHETLVLKPFTEETLLGAVRRELDSRRVRAIR